MEKKTKKVKKCLTEVVEHDKLEKSPKGERSSLKTKQNVKNHERKKFRKLRKQTIMESLILAQDERWRRA